MDLTSFAGDVKSRNFITKFLLFDEPGFRQSAREDAVTQMLTLQYNDCLVRDTLHAFRIYMDLYTTIIKQKAGISTFDIWQFNIIKTAIERYDSKILSTEHLRSIIISLENYVESQLSPAVNALIHCYLFSPKLSYLKETKELSVFRMLVAAITLYELPINVLNLVEYDPYDPSDLEILLALKELGLDGRTNEMIIKFKENPTA